ncbi:MAG: hypothetical protein AVDCRST_MAG76-2876, partial [uncultured Acidimicrobiales bacterium]
AQVQSRHRWAGDRTGARGVRIGAHRAARRRRFRSRAGDGARRASRDDHHLGGGAGVDGLGVQVAGREAPHSRWHPGGVLSQGGRAAAEGAGATARGPGVGGAQPAVLRRTGQPDQRGPGRPGPLPRRGARPGLRASHPRCPFPGPCAPGARHGRGTGRVPGGLAGLPRGRRGPHRVDHLRHRCRPPPVGHL